MIPIDKDELLKVLRQRYDNLKQWYKNANEDAKTSAAFAMTECFEIGNIVKEQPTVDAVHIVRCKDCKWYVYSEKAFGHVCYFNSSYRREDDYCSDGERKTENENE